MNQKEIRDTCYKCGNRRKMYLDGAEFASDYCRAAMQECSKIKTCDPSMRIPKVGSEHRHVEPITTHEAEFPAPEDTIPQKE
jgi:predicted  nucleic acid-binding Zn-ribbon protein